MGMRFYLVTVESNLNGPRYQSYILEPLSVLILTAMLWPRDQCLWVTMLDPHRTRAVVDFLQRNSRTTILWMARSSDLNPFEKFWDILGQRLRQRHPLVNNLALYQERQAIPQRQI